MAPNRLSRLIIALLAVALFVSGSLNWILFNQGQQYYLQLNETRLDPLQLGYFDAGTPANLTKTRVVFFGDSRAAEWPAPTNPGSFGFINRGIGAQTTAQALYRSDFHLAPLQPGIVIVQIGINDLKTIPLFPERKETIIADCKDNIQRIVSKSVNLGATVILTTIFPVGPAPLERQLFWPLDVPEAVFEVNAYLESLANSEVIIFDAYAVLAGGNGMTQSEYARDTLHLTSEGYAALNTELASILVTLK